MTLKSTLVFALVASVLAAPALAVSLEPAPPIGAKK